MYESLKQRLREAEGVVPCLYLDKDGFVTVGVGHLVDSPDEASALGFKKPDSDSTDEEDIHWEYYSVQEMTPGQLPKYYLERTVLRLSDDAISSLLDRDLEEEVTLLAKAIAGFEKFPESAREALLDMAFQCGVYGLEHKFPRMMLAVGARDWNTCATECHRPDAQESRNAATVALFKQAATEVAA